ncbi:hypothetical protein SLS58_008713 [Diplodia intermedia]|uniref:Uncharacterized protein n=1 Tax=Diplodia intermedia TaxID=856260 RepID=A0ABR3TGX3_9PEZI
MEIFRGKCIPWDEQVTSDDEAMDVESEDESLEEETELGQLLVSIHETITFLLRLSAAIKNPAPHDHFMNSSKLVPAQAFERFDISHVREKFPSAPESVAEVLGKSISRRREYFRYRESHNKKLSEGISRPVDEDAKTEYQPLSTVASSIPQELKVNDNVLELEAEQLSDSGFLTDAMSGSSMNSNIIDDPGNVRAVARRALIRGKLVKSTYETFITAHETPNK